MSNPILTKAELTTILDQMNKLEKGEAGVNISSLTLSFGNGTSGTFTKSREHGWQITLAGRVTDGYR